MLSALKKAHRRFYFRPSFIVKKMASVRSLDQILLHVKVGFSMLFDVLSYKR